MMWVLAMLVQLSPFMYAYAANSIYAIVAAHVHGPSGVWTIVTRRLHKNGSNPADAKIAIVLAFTTVGACKGAQKSCHCISPQFPDLFHYVIIG